MKKIFLAVLALSLTATTVSAQEYLKKLAKVQKDKTESWETVPQGFINAIVTETSQNAEDMSPEQAAAFTFAQKMTLAASKECYEEDLPAIKKALKGYDNHPVPQELRDKLAEQNSGMELSFYTKTKSKKIGEMVMVFDFSSVGGPINVVDMMFADGVPKENLEQMMKAMMKQ